MAKVMRKEASAYAKAESSLRKPPVPEHLPPKPDLMRRANSLEKTLMLGKIEGRRRRGR